MTGETTYMHNPVYTDTHAHTYTHFMVRGLFEDRQRF